MEKGKIYPILGIIADASVKPFLVMYIQELLFEALAVFFLTFSFCTMKKPFFIAHEWLYCFIDFTYLLAVFFAFHRPLAISGRLTLMLTDLFGQLFKTHTADPFIG